jgi:hypothetical protein
MDDAARVDLSVVVPLYNEARGADGNWIHRSYLAK